MAVNEASLRCPQDVALVGFDDHPWATVSRPSLTVVRQPATRLGRTVAEMLLKLMDGEELPEERVVLECDLVSRESC